MRQWRFLKLLKRTVLQFIFESIPERSLEPKYLRFIKLIFAFAIYLACLAYLIYLALGIKYENPDVEIAIEEVKNIPAPFGQIITSNGVECTHYIQPTYKNDANLYVGYWNNSIQRNVPSVIMDDIGISNIIVQFFVNQKDLQTTRLIESNPVNNNSMIISFSDAETENINFASSVHKESIDLSNTYILSPKQKYLLWFWRLQKKDLDLRNWKNKVGFESKKNDYYIIETLIQNADPINATNFPFSIVDIRYQTRFVEIDTQTKQNTILALLSSLGGAYGIGTQQIGPWGMAYEIYGVRNSLKKRVKEKFQSHFPLVEIKYPDNISDEDITLGKINQRLHDLEWQNSLLQLLIREYVIDIGNFAELKKSIDKRNQTEV
ncbi:12954_t:CDS:2 [Ambispora leptoticha]|uniref:12954_t:CDS:1 n=1 Tax=Ambispora leptoticha TaxID=144679 RepID=A0A9N9CWQ5_9GLOM|nr:12954_t:CDS:2 [Ambispora leptoticha]